MRTGIALPVMMVELHSRPMLPMASLRNPHKMGLYCRDLRKMICKDPSWMLNEESLLCRKVNVDGKVQVSMPLKYRTAALYNAHHPKLAGHSGGSRMCDTLRRQCYWPCMPSDVDEFVTDVLHVDNIDRRINSDSF